MSAEHVSQLMRHHRWAVGRLLDTAALVPAEDLERPGLSHESIFATLRHIADVDQSWGRRARGEQDLSVEEMTALAPELAALRDFWLPEADDLVRFARGLTDADLEREVQPPWKRQPYRVWQILTHIATHRGEHGNQVGWQLTALGQSPGEMGFLGFVDLERS